MTSGARRLADYLLVFTVLLAATAIGAAIFPFTSVTDVAMLYLLGAGVAAARVGRGPGVLAGLLSIALFDFFFIPPRYTFAISDWRYLITFAVMLGAVLGVGALAHRVREQADRMQKERVEVEAERLRTSLLSSLSHDLRTPLGAITGAASSLLEDDSALPLVARHDLAETILEEAQRMNRLIGNLLDMIRVETGALRVHREWQPLEEVIGVARMRLGDRLHAHPVTVRLPADLPLVPLDGLLIEQVLINLLENAIKYTPPGTPIDIAAARDDGAVRVSVADRGPGLVPGEEARVFEKFYRSPTVPTSASGVGLGLTICKGIVTSHGGKIWAESRPGGGAVFHFTLALTGAGAPPNEVPASPEAKV
ncbi:MAG TPA: ATP-binding protein [Gemmatimonadales bacterium]